MVHCELLSEEMISSFQLSRCWRRTTRRSSLLRQLLTIAIPNEGPFKWGVEVCIKNRCQKTRVPSEVSRCWQETLKVRKIHFLNFLFRKMIKWIKLDAKEPKSEDTMVRSVLGRCSKEALDIGIIKCRHFDDNTRALPNESFYGEG